MFAAPGAALKVAVGAGNPRAACPSQQMERAGRARTYSVLGGITRDGAGRDLWRPSPWPSAPGPRIPGETHGIESWPGWIDIACAEVLMEKDLCI